MNTTKKIFQYSVGAAIHLLGKKWLYRSQTYRSVVLWKNSRAWKLDAKVDPLKILWIKPSEVEYVTGRGPNPGRFQWQHLGMVKSGDWDQSTELFERMDIYIGLYERYNQQRSWEETDFIRCIEKEVAQGGSDWKTVQSTDEIKKACANVDELYESIKQHGYRTMNELVEHGEIKPETKRVPEELRRKDEVVVDIGRDGQFLFVDGRHRLAIAKILNLENIPVRVAARHTRWQAIRERIAAVDDPRTLPDSVAQYLDHPDLQDMLEDDK